MKQKRLAAKNAAAAAEKGSFNAITEGVIWKQLLLFFFPILFGTFFQQLYNTTDAVIVGNFVGKEALAAVGGSTATLINLLVGFFMGLSSGASVIISQYFGAKSGGDVNKAVHTAVALSICGGLLLMAVGILISPWALRLMHTPEDIIDYSITYLRIYFCGMIPSLFYNMGSGILRAVGDSKRPLYFLILSCFINIVLDVFFVAVLDMKVLGVAFATVLSQVCSALMTLFVLLRTKADYRLFPRQIRFHGRILENMVRIGLPSGLQSVMYAASNIIIQSSINGFGTDTVAAYTAYGKIDGLFWMIMGAFGIAITTFAGQNYGAGKYERVRKSVRVCLLLTLLTTVGITALVLTAGQPILRLFTDDQAVIRIGLEILRFIVPVYFTYICIEILSGAARGCGSSLLPMIITCLGVCVLRVVWIFAAVPFHRDLKTVLFSYPLTWTVTSVLFLLYYRFGKWLPRGDDPEKEGAETV